MSTIIGLGEDKSLDLRKKRPYLDTTDLPVQEALYKIIDIYLKENSHLNLETLANGDIGRTTLYTFLKHFPEKTLGAECILGLMRSVHNDLSLSEVSRIYAGELGKFLRESTDHYNDHSKDRFASPLMEEMLRNTDTYLTFLLISSKNGISIEDLRSGLGDPYVRRVERYVQKGDLVKRHGRIYLKHKIDNISINVRTTLELARNLINNNYNLDNFGDDEKSNILHVLFGFINPNHPAIKVKLRDMNKKYIEEVRVILEEAKGDQPFWVVLVGDWLLDFLLKHAGNGKGDLQ